MDLDITWAGPPIDDQRILRKLPSDLAKMLKSVNGFIQLDGTLHVRGACQNPVQISAFERLVEYWLIERGTHLSVETQVALQAATELFWRRGYFPARETFNSMQAYVRETFCEPRFFANHRRAKASISVARNESGCGRRNLKSNQLPERNHVYDTAQLLKVNTDRTL